MGPIAGRGVELNVRGVNVAPMRCCARLRRSRCGVMPELFQSCYRTTITAGPGRRAASALASPVGGFARFASVLLCVGAESVVPAAVRSAKEFRVRKNIDFRVFSWKMALE